MEERFLRHPELARETRFLPANTYNLTRLLLTHTKDGHVFVPIRAMQYLAIMDAREMLFVDGQHKSWVQIAWCNFRPGARDSLADRVAYEAIYYEPGAREIMQRLQGEFAKALQLLARRRPAGGTHRVVDFHKPDIKN